MAAALGNQNARKAKPWTDSIRKAIVQYDTDKAEDKRFLFMLAKQMLEDCFSSDVSERKHARDELWNRLDGKYPQPIIGDEDNPLEMVHKVVREIVRTKDSNC